MGLNAEDGLHVGGSRCHFRALEVEYGSPFRHADTGGELTAGKRYGVVIFANGFPDFFKSLAIDVLCVAVTGNIGNFKLPENLMLVEKLFKGGRFLHSRHHPECMAEFVLELFGREWIVLIVGIAEFRQKSIDFGLMHKATNG